MASLWMQLKTLLWRNILLKKRNKRQVLQELLFPIYFIAILAMTKALVKPSTKPEIPAFPANSLSNESFHFNTSKTLLVTPDTPHVRNIVKSVAVELGNMKYEIFENKTAAEARYKSNPDSVGAGIIFGYSGSNLSYAIRMPYDGIPSAGSLFTNLGQCRNDPNGTSTAQCQAKQYLKSGFVWLQNIIDTVLIRVENNDPTFPLPNVAAQLLPKLEYTVDLSYIQILSSIYFVYAYSFFINFLTVNIVSEKEKKIREAMKMMGLRDSAFWLSWALLYAVMIFIVTLLVLIIAVAASFFKHSNMFIFFLMLYFYGLSIINLAFALTPFFNKAQTAGFVAGFSTIIISLLYLVVSMTRTAKPLGGYDYSIPPAGRWVLCLLSPVALALAVDQGIYLDIAKGGMDFSTISTGDFPLYGSILMLIVDTILYGLLAFYLDRVIPGEYGPRYVPWYCFMPSYWRQQKTGSISENSFLVNHDQSNNYQPTSRNDSGDIEPVSEDLQGKAGLSISNITKKFDKSDETVTAVDGLSLDIYEGQITALLGHNGAGKTTLINMLCGLTPPTSGTAHILGLDVAFSGDMEQIRTMCGVCPQQNILFDDLSCREHLKVFAGIKGVPPNQQDAVVEKSLKDADIADQADVFARSLSGGQKRKLSVAIALIGNPKIIFLDEPTAGMDPFSRRRLWALLKSRKEGNIILLTTHFMDEADILADRKAIINHGKLRCYGSSLFLKNRFGIGYHLNMVVEPDCDPVKVTTLLSQLVSSVELKRSHAKELAFTIPLSEVTNFSKLFAALEKKTSDGKTCADSLGIRSYGVSMTSLEEVFLKLGEDEDPVKVSHVNQGFSAAGETRTAVGINISETTHSGSQIEVEINPSLLNYSSSSLDDSSVNKQKFWALFKMRFLLHIRSPISLIFQVFFPALFVVVGCILNKVATTSTDSSDPSPLVIDGLYLTNGSALPLLVIDSIDDGLSKSFISNLSTKFDVDLVNNSVDLLEIGQHWMGMNLQDLEKNLGYNYTALYNDSAIHSLPAVISIMSNALFDMTGDKGSTINTTSLPWPSISTKLKYNQNVFSSVILLAMAFVVIAPGFAVHIVQDRQFKVRSQLRVTGVKFNLYWGTLFVFNLLMFLIPAILSVIVVLAVQIPSLSSGGAVLSLVLVFITYIPCAMMLSYVFSFAFDNFETCMAVLINVFIMTGLLPYLVVSLLDLLGSESTAKILHYVFIVIDPTYAIFGALYYIDRIYRISMVTNQEIHFETYFKWENNIIFPYIMSLLHCCWLYMLLRVLDVRSTGGNVKEAIRCGDTSKVEDIPEENSDKIEGEDEDVRAERDRVTALMTEHSDQKPVAYVQNLRKEFTKRGKTTYKDCRKIPAEEKIKVAVRNATVAFDSGEVFGLLGPNGAGKTTLLNMMIAETAATRGKVIVAGHNVNSSLSKAFQALGYCPQHDALWELITLREHIEFYAAMRGIAAQDIGRVADFFIENLKVQEHEKKHAKKLSGGTKRKLSYAMSMLGTPEIVLLDEPSTGMDPQSKRFLWDTISMSFQTLERGAILTTHYMEEADALCSRIAIMINGEMECLGTSQHLKDKYGSGYLLEIKLQNPSVDIEQRMDALDEHLVSMFPGATVVERFAERGQYKIPREDVKSLSETFSALEETKTSHGVEEYSFSQSTLEQIFLDFAKKQLEEDADHDALTKKKAYRRTLSHRPLETQIV